MYFIYIIRLGKVKENTFSKEMSLMIMYSVFGLLKHWFVSSFNKMSKFAS